MAYSRFDYDSDIYMFHGTDNMIVCCGCKLLTTPSIFASGAEVLKHLEAHMSAGHKVPDQLIPMIKNEIKRHGDDVEKW